MQVIMKIDKLLQQKHKELIIFNFAASADYSKIISNINTKKTYILSNDFIPNKAIDKLKEIFNKYNQTEFVFFTEFGYDYWNLENVKVFQYNIFLYQALLELNSIKEFCFDYKSKKSKNFSVLIGSSCKERFDILSAVGSIGNLKNSYYTLLDKNLTPYMSDSKKYEFLFGENFENYQINFKTKSYNYTSNTQKFKHKDNFYNIQPLIIESYFYIGLENMSITGKDNISEKTLYGYITGTPTFNVIGPEARSMLLELGFKSTPLFEIEKNYNKKTYDETLIEYMKDISFLCSFDSGQWKEYYIGNHDVIYHNYNNLDNAFEIVKSNIHTVLDS